MKHIFDTTHNLRSFLVAEIAQAHDGSLGAAHSFIDLAADLGVDAIKFQTHIADAESTQDEEFRVAFSREDKTRFDYWRRMEFEKDQWRGLIDHAGERGLAFGTSCFSIAAFEMIAPLGVDFWKVGSGEVVSTKMIAMMAQTSIPVLLSSGLSTEKELANAVNIVRSCGAPVGVFQCTSKYPTNYEEIGLNRILELRETFCCPTGLSDHSGEIWPSVAAISQGAEIIEFHLAFHKGQFGPDTAASLVPDQVSVLVAARDAIARMMKNPIIKGSLTDEQKAMRALFGRSLALRRQMKAGEAISRDDLVFKKPASGIKPEEIDRVIGRTLVADKSPERLLTWKDFK